MKAAISRRFCRGDVKIDKKGDSMAALQMIMLLGAVAGADYCPK
jgi:hypothetical protein